MSVHASASWAGIRHALGAAATLGLVSAVADWIWFRFLEDGALLPALGHGLLFFVVIALVLPPTGPGRAASIRRLLATLPLVGLGLAAIFYPLAAWTGYLGALLITWAGMWIALALLLQWATKQPGPLSAPILRGLIASVLSGAAFASVSWMWTDPAPGGPSVPLHFLCWTWALLPGFVTLLVRRSGSAAPSAESSASSVEP